MNLQQFFVFFLVCAGFSATFAWNGPYYQCDPQVLEDDSLCYLIASDEAPEEFLPLSPHNVDIDDVEDFHGCIVDTKMSDNVCLSTLFKPWDQGTVLLPTDEEREGQDWMYVLLFEMIAPIRDIFMYDPWALLTDTDADDNWALYTKVLEDCHIKEVSQMQQMDDDEWYLARNLEDLKTAMYPVEGDMSWEVVWFVEEIQHMLLCVMTDLGVDVTSCREYMGNNGIKDGQWSDCWVEAYEEMWGVEPVYAGELSPSIWVDSLALIDADEATFGITSNVDATISCIAQADSMDYPSADEVNSGLDSNDDAAHSTASGEATAGETFTFQMIELVDGFNYEIICATDDGILSSKVDFTPGESLLKKAKSEAQAEPEVLAKKKPATALKKRTHTRRKPSDLARAKKQQRTLSAQFAGNATLTKGKKTVSKTLLSKLKGKK